MLPETDLRASRLVRITPYVFTFIRKQIKSLKVVAVLHTVTALHCRLKKISQVKFQNSQTCFNFTKTNYYAYIKSPRPSAAQEQASKQILMSTQKGNVGVTSHCKKFDGLASKMTIVEKTFPVSARSLIQIPIYNYTRKPTTPKITLRKM